MRKSFGISLGLLGLLALPVQAAGPAQASNTLTAQERAAGWRLLFNGRNLDGWRSFDGGGPSPLWVVRDGTLALTANSEHMTGADLVTAGNYATFELTLDWKIARGGNSGVLYLARNQAPAKQVYETGLEMQVLDNAGNADGKIPSHRAGSLYDLTVPPAGAAHPAGSWNHARLRVERGRIRQWLNGVPTADVSYGDAAWRARVAASKFATMPLFGTFTSGVIALQDHGYPVAFRNIKLRRLGAATGVRAR